MARPKSDKEGITLNLHKVTLLRLKEFCTKSDTTPSNYVNHLLTRVFATRKDMWRERARQVNSEFQELMFLIDNFEERPIGEYEEKLEIRKQEAKE